MKITYFDSYEALSWQAAKTMEESVTKKPDLFFCAATGGSPTGMYAEMQRLAKGKPSLFSRMRVMKMDEWGIIPLSHPDSCESYLKKHLVGPLGVSADRYLTYDPSDTDLDAVCDQVAYNMAEWGPIDVCLLGLGKNGHIAFNEPAGSLQKDFHKAVLAPSTIQHDPMLAEGSEPAFGLCVGMMGILQSKKIIFLVTGKGKQDAIRAILDGRISTQLPASFLWLHSDVACYIDRNSL